MRLQPVIWFGRVPSAYMSIEKLFAKVFNALRMRSLARFAMRWTPLLTRRSKPDATMLIAIWRQLYSAAVTRRSVRCSGVEARVALVRPVGRVLQTRTIE
jgi:hypothetical protein